MSFLLLPPLWILRRRRAALTNTRTQNLDGEPPVGLFTALCWTSSATAGDAACEKNYVVNGGSGNANVSYTMPTYMFTPSYTSTSTTISSTTVVSPTSTVYPTSSIT